MNESKTMRRLDKQLAKCFEALHEALELLRLRSSIEAKGNQPQGGYKISCDMLSERVLTAYDSVNKAIDHFAKLSEKRRSKV